MKTTDFIHIGSWMVGLGLTDKQLLLYALIWNTSKSGSGLFKGTASYIAEWLGCTERNVKKIIRQLEDLGLIQHEVIRTVKRTYTIFWAIDPDEAQAPEKGSKAKIDWIGRTPKFPTGRERKFPIEREPQFPTEDVSIYSQDNNIYKNTRDRYNGARRARKPAPEATPDLFVPEHKTKRFAPPSVEDVAAYCQERCNSVDPQRFVDFYTSNGWKVGKSAMKDWRAAVRTWEARDRETPRRSQPAQREYESPEAHNLRILRQLQERDGMLNSIVDEQ